MFPEDHGRRTRAAGSGLVRQTAHVQRLSVFNVHPAAGSERGGVGGVGADGAGWRGSRMRTRV